MTSGEPSPDPAPRRSTTGRGDLLRAWITGGEDGLSAMARLLGYREVAPEAPPERPRGTLGEASKKESSPAASPQPSEAPPFAPVPFWRLEEIAEVEPQASGPVDTDAPPFRLSDLGQLPGERRPQPPDLVSLARLWPSLRRRLLSTSPSRQVDVPALAEQWSRGRVPSSIPFRPQAAWVPRVMIVLDRSPRLIPFWEDQNRVLRGLRRQMGTTAVREVVYLESSKQPWLDEHGCYPALPASPGEAVLVLGDLGSLGSPAQKAAWRGEARRLRRFRSRSIALLPTPADRWDHAETKSWESIDWSRPRKAPRFRRPLEATERRGRAERLLALLSFASRIEPGLLRTVRRLLPPEEADLGTETDSWNHPDLASGFSGAASLAPEARKRLQARFVREDPQLKEKVVEAIRRWRTGLPEEIWLEEVHGLASTGDLPAGALTWSELQRARELWKKAAATVEETGKVSPQLARAVRGFARRSLYDRQPEAIWQDDELRPLLWKIWKAVWQGEGPVPYPPGLGPEILGPSGEPLRRWRVDQQGGDLRFLPADSKPETGSPLALLSAERMQVKLEGGPRISDTFPLDAGALIPLPTSPEPFLSLHTARAVERPPWATAAGRDRFGIWASFEVEGVVQKMRWIPPGKFLMGSPEDEQGRSQDEGPRHPEKIRDGFWLAETPCTQALWQAVRGENPSEFRSPDRPVESVSWESCSAFLGELKELVNGLDPRLPSESEWEYACRAGQGTATYGGPMKILGTRNAPVLDSIAWYGGNSGVGFELALGRDSTEWTETQYSHNLAGTRPVALKAPNAWGLYDMLGNVNEWCSDLWSRDYTAPREGANRVIRGGSWYGRARYARAAYRHSNPTWVRYNDLGFRFAQASPKAFHGTSPTPRGAGPAIILRTDRSAALLRRIERPDWASAMGRDRYGLWAAFEVRGVKQRMRWIVPGTYWMGSPEDEPGRYEDEGPRHLETVPRGFWLGETPCTQDLWEAVTGENPSKFQSPDRPVESVSWDTCREFMAALNRRVEGLEARFPLEAEWEYACRAGTEAATYAGPIDILGESNAPILDAIAWYGGNSGVDFELENGVDSSEWPEKQHPHSKAGTRFVGLKEPNAWGLYDMLGNVYEWCADPWRPNYSSLPEGSDRVIRGGSWRNSARDVRAAYRSLSLPSYRVVNLGFRLARGQGALPPGAEPQGSGAERPGAEPGQGGAGPEASHEPDAHE